VSSFLAGALLLASSASGARIASRSQAASVAAAVDRALRLPASCRLQEAVTVSGTSPDYALAAPHWWSSGPCVKYSANGVNILKRTAGGWRIVWSGSVQPTCRQLPPRVVLDLTGRSCMSGARGLPSPLRA
jgi:hypothetical protein